MPLVIEDRVRETTTVTGTNDATLLGAVTGFQAFSVIGNGNTTYYTISDQSGGNWEVGIGTYSSIGPTLARTTVLSSSAGGSKVSFPAGTKDVFVTYPSEKSVNLDESDFVIAGGSSNIGLNGNLTFNGTGKRIIGDFSNATHANRLLFQTSTTNGNTIVGFIPNGTATISQINLYNNSDTTNTSVLQLSAQGSTATAISSGNTGTGTFLPLVFNTSGTERLRIDTSGNVGVGTTAPSSVFNTAATGSGTNVDVAYFQNLANNVAGSAVSIKLGATAVSTRYSYIQSLVESGTANAQSLCFGTNANGATPTEKMRIDSNGNVGIGTVSPGTYGKLTAENATTCTITAVATGTGIVSTVLASNNSSAIGISGTSSNHPYLMITNGTERMRLTAAGNVGILSSAPTATLSVGTNGSGTATPLAFLAYNSTALGTALDDMRYISEFGGSAGNNVRLLFALHRTSIADPNWGTTAWRIQPAVDASFTGAGSNRGYVELAFGNQGAYQGIGLSGSGTTTPDFIVNNSGNVGIGTLNPAYKLAINDSGTGLGFTNAASGNFNIGLLAGVADANAYIYQRANAALIIGTNNTERMRITSAGFVGINNSSPTQYLQVNNGALFSQGSSDWFGIRGNSQTIPPADTGSNAVLAINGNFSNGGGEVNFWNTTSIAGGFRFMQRTGSSTYNDMMYMQGNTGRVGINTLSPAAQLNIVDATASGSFSNALIVQKSDAATSAYYNGARINLQNTSATANNYMSIGFGAASGTDVAAIWSSASVHTGGAATGYLAFGTNNAGTAASERMRIAAGGGVSIASSANNGEVFRTSQNAASNPSTSGDMTTGVIFQAGDGAGALNIGNNNVVTWYNSAYANNAGVPLAHAWYTGGTEKMRILSGGDVCVGTTTSTFIYQGSNTTTSAFTISTGGYDCLNLISTAVNPTLDFSALNSTSNVFRFANIQGVMTTNTAGSEAGALTFNTSTGSANSTERMRVSATGDVLINTTDNTLYNNTSGYGVCYRVNASFDVLSTNDICVILNRTGTDGTILEFRKAGTVVGSVSVTGSATAYNTASDYRLKENIAPMMGALDTVAKLKPVTYDWKDGGSSQGFIAHELADVVPDAVTGEKDAVDEEGKAVYQGIDTSFLVATLTAAIQEQQALIEKLTNRLNALEGK